MVVLPFQVIPPYYVYVYTVYICVGLIGAYNVHVLITYIEQQV